MTKVTVTARLLNYDGAATAHTLKDVIATLYDTAASVASGHLVLQFGSINVFTQIGVDGYSSLKVDGLCSRTSVKTSCQNSSQHTS